MYYWFNASTNVINNIIKEKFMPINYNKINIIVYM